MKIVIIASKSNDLLMEKYLQKLEEEFCSLAITKEQISTYFVPGCLDIPRFAKKLSQDKHYDIVLCLGVILSFGHPSFPFMGQAVFSELLHLSVEGVIPLINGIITALTPEQAEKDINYYVKKISTASQEILELERNFL